MFHFLRVSSGALLLQHIRLKATRRTIGLILKRRWDWRGVEMHAITGIDGAMTSPYYRS